MRVLIVHNYYQQKGGEDIAVAAHQDLLERRGHAVSLYTASNFAVDGMNRLELAAATLWNYKTYQALRAKIRSERPDIVHFHNTFPLISSSAYDAAHREGVPVIQTLHNFRLICLNSMLLRRNRVCLDCTKAPVPLAGVIHACYRGSRQASAVVAAMIVFNRAINALSSRVDRYISLTNFSRNILVQNGLPAKKVRVLPNTLANDPGCQACSGVYALFAGRLSPEKGIWTLLQAWKDLPSIPLTIAGEGGEIEAMKAYVTRENLSHINFLGWCDRERMVNTIQQARVVIFPSQCYENFPMVLIEAFACGKPVIASRMGGIPNIVQEGQNGWLFTPGDPQDLADKVKRAWEEPALMEQLASQARQSYEQDYNPESVYNGLIEIYNGVLSK